MKAVVIQEPIAQPDLTPQELTARWQALAALPGVDEVTILTPPAYPSAAETGALAADADALFGVWIGPDLINADFLAHHPRLRYIATLGHGWEPFDTGLARAHGLTVTNTVYGAQTIAEYAFALLMEVCHHISVQNARLRVFDWADPANAGEFCKAVVPQLELYGKTVGVVGLGEIGFAFARMVAGFGVRVLGFSAHRKQDPRYDFITQVESLDELLALSDIVSLHLPHTPETEHILNAATFAKMKDGAILINTARGALVEEAALAAALRTGKLRAAGLDVLTEEPPRHGTPLLQAPNLTVTGHIAWLTRASRLRAIEMAVDNFAHYLRGEACSAIVQPGDPAPNTKKRGNMMQVETLLRRSIREKPASKRSARQKTSTPRDMVRMNLNENAYGMSDTVQQALRASVADNSMYQDFYAYDIRKKVADLHGLTADHILIGAGSSAVIDMLGEVFINYGDEVLYCSPTYEAFPDMVSDNGGVRVEVPLTADYRFDLAALRAAVTDKTKMVILVNPNNPTGTCLPAAEVEAFVRSLPDHVLAVVDEAYFEYVDTPGHYSLIRLVQQGYGKPLIVLRTFSKIYGLAGLRIGYAVADPALIDQLMKACQAWNVSRIATLAATVALDDQAYVEKVRAANTIERQRLYSGLRALGCTVAEPAANFLYFDTGRDAAAVSGALAGRLILIGTPNARFNRVTVGTPAENAAFLQALAEVLDALPKRAT